MAIALSDLLSDLEREAVLEDFIAVAQVLGLTTTAWQPGEPIYDLLDIFANQIATLWNDPIVRALRAVFLDDAEGAWLTLFARTFYNVQRGAATFATISVVLENRSALFHDVSAAGAVTVTNAAGKTFTSTGPASGSTGTLAPWPGSGAYPTTTLVFQADEAGSGSNTAINTIAATSVSGPSNVFVQSNAAGLASDEETDDQVKRRCRARVASLSASGPRAKYEDVALGVRRSATDDPVMPGEEGYDDATPLNINRIRIEEPGDCTVNVWLAAPSGAASGDDVTAGTDVYIANAAIQKHCTPPGMTVNVASAVEVPIDYTTIVVYLDRDSGVTQTEGEETATSALTAFFRVLAIGGDRKSPGGQGWAYIDRVKIVAGKGAGVFEVDSSQSDVALDVNEVAVPTFTVLGQVVSQQ
jgi:phage-related baseplate assembly protein